MKAHAMKFGPGDIRTGKRWHAIQTRHYVVMFDNSARKLTDPKRFAAGAERRLKAIAKVLGLRKDGPDGRYALRGAIPYFVHDPKVLRYGNVEFRGIDVPATGMHNTFYQHEEAHAVLTWSTGNPPSFFNEGFACFASQPQYDGSHRCSLVGIRHGLVPALREIAWSDGFWKHYKTYKPFMYRVAGSFFAWTFAEYGKEPFLRFAARCDFDATRPQILTEFRKAYGVALGTAEQGWKAWLLLRREDLAMSSRRRMGNIRRTANISPRTMSQHTM